MGKITMFRSALQRIGSSATQVAKTNSGRTSWVRCMAGGPKNDGPVFNARAEITDDDLIKSLQDPKMDGWQLREVLNRIHGMDLVPAPAVLIAAMHACRKVNEYSLAVRCLEAAQWKCGPQVKTIWPYLQKEIQPTLDELGILTPEGMGYDKPELYTENVDNMHTY